MHMNYMLIVEYNFIWTVLNLYLYVSKIAAKFWKSVIGSDQIDKLEGSL